MDNHLRNHVIEEYFHMGLNYKEIVDCLFLNDEIHLSLRQLKRILAKKISDDDATAALMR